MPLARTRFGLGGGYRAYATPAGFNETVTLVTSWTSDPCTATAVGGTPTYTYAWTLVSGAVTINSPTAATTTFTVDTPSAGPAGGTVRCTITDANAQEATVDVVIAIERDE